MFILICVLLFLLALVLMGVASPIQNWNDNRLREHVRASFYIKWRVPTRRCSDYDSVRERIVPFLIEILEKQANSRSLELEHNDPRFGIIEMAELLDGQVPDNAVPYFLPYLKSENVKVRQAAQSILFQSRRFDLMLENLWCLDSDDMNLFHIALEKSLKRGPLPNDMIAAWMNKLRELNWIRFIIDGRRKELSKTLVATLSVEQIERNLLINFRENSAYFTTQQIRDLVLNVKKEVEIPIEWLQLLLSRGDPADSELLRNLIRRAQDDRSVHFTWFVLLRSRGEPADDDFFLELIERNPPTSAVAQGAMAMRLLNMNLDIGKLIEKGQERFGFNLPDGPRYLAVTERLSYAHYDDEVKEYLLEIPVQYWRDIPAAFRLSDMEPEAQLLDGLLNFIVAPPLTWTDAEAIRARLETLSNDDLSDWFFENDHCHGTLIAYRRVDDFVRLREMLEKTEP